MKDKLSDRQQRILDFIGEFMDEKHYPPTVRDIQHGCDVSSTSVVDYNLQILQRDGYLQREREVSRGIKLKGRESNDEKLRARIEDLEARILSVPIYARIAAGAPLPVPSQGALEDPNLEQIEIPPSLAQGKDNVYALRVEGTSMIDAFIADGDLVLVEPVAQPDNGDMVAAWLTDDDEVTLKRFYLEGDSVRLQPANSTMQPITLPADKVAVKGRVVGVIRTV